MKFLLSCSSDGKNGGVKSCSEFYIVFCFPTIFKFKKKFDNLGYSGNTDDIFFMTGALNMSTFNNTILSIHVILNFYSNEEFVFNVKIIA